MKISKRTIVSFDVEPNEKLYTIDYNEIKIDLTSLAPGTNWINKKLAIT